MRQIAFYGKGGIGKLTTTSNISAALAEMGYRVLQIGCDPKADSTKNLTDGNQIYTILDTIRDREFLEKKAQGRQSIALSDLVKEGYRGVLCCEAGGPEPGVGCAGRGVITAIELLQELNAFEIFKPDFVFYDVLGDVVCGGFAMPIREGFAEEIYVITSGEIMSIFACNNIFKGISRYSKSGLSRVGGIILNSRNTEDELEIVEQFASKTSTKLIQAIPRDNIVHNCEINGKTVIEGEPESLQADYYRELAKKILNNSDTHIPVPMNTKDFHLWVKNIGSIKVLV